MIAPHRKLPHGTVRRSWFLGVTTLLLAGLAAPSGLALGAAGSGAADAAIDAGAGYTPPACHRPKAAPVPATPVAGVPSDWTITSFDGTKIRAHWFPAPGASAAHPDPTVLEGPGWGEAGATKSTGDILGSVSITGLNNDGYNVLTWDPRGFGQSTGTIEVDSPSFEARDVSRLIDWVATRPGVQLDRPGDPRLGMVGGSYGGGIQFVTAAQDCRIDAIVPEIAWHSLTTSLDKAGTPKTGWSNLLYTIAPAGHIDPHLTSAYQESNATGTISAADAQWFASKGPGNLVNKIRVPTLIIQGTVDNLFTLNEGVTNFKAIQASHVPVHMIWFCGGHGVCLTKQGDPNYTTDATVAWLNRWVKRQPSVKTGPTVDVIDQDGNRYAAPNYPLPTARALRGQGSGTLQLVATGGSGPAVLPAGLVDPLGGVADSITPGQATNAVDVPITNGSKPTLVVGAPRLTMTYQGTVPAGARPTRVFAQLVDGSTGLVLGNQVTPIDVTLDGQTHTTSVPLEIVSQAMAAGQHVTLQLVATTVAYAQPRLGGSVTFSAVKVALPVVAGVTPK
jgi:ABC-2 type transport system ATP-binding protein